MTTIATQLDLVMNAIWDSKVQDSGEDTPTIRALVSYVRSHAQRCNVENVFEVISILWGANVRTLKQRDDGCSASEYVVDVQFDDESQVVVECRCGIGNGLQLI